MNLVSSVSKDYISTLTYEELADLQYIYRLY